jgi:DeoR/GlpR family transcriptional regulator of sugar metabolism
VRADVAVLGVGSVHPDVGVTAQDSEEAGVTVVRA